MTEEVYVEFFNRENIMVCCEPQKLQEISELCCLTVFSQTQPQEILSLNSSIESIFLFRTT